VSAAFIASQKPRGSRPWVSSPQLLVSVRNAAEAQAALTGGADIIDVKEPAAGSLGRASPAAIRDVAAVVAREPRGLSVALGEMVEWNGDASRLPASVRWVKLGLSNCASDAGWMSRWQTCRRQFEDAHRQQIGWIAVAYADCVAANAPPPDQLLAAAVETRCTGVLLDTFAKHGQQLRDWMSPDEISDWIKSAREHGLTTAVAGSLQVGDLEWLCPLQPDLIAIRSAACRQGVRTACIDAEAVTRFRQALLAASG